MEIFYYLHSNLYSNHPNIDKVSFFKFFVVSVKETRNSYLCVSPVNVCRRKLLTVITLIKLANSIMVLLEMHQKYNCPFLTELLSSLFVGSF